MSQSLWSRLAQVLLAGSLLFLPLMAEAEGNGLALFSATTLPDGSQDYTVKIEILFR